MIYKSAEQLKELSRLRGKQHDELMNIFGIEVVHLKSETLGLSEDTK